MKKSQKEETNLYGIKKKPRWGRFSDGPPKKYGVPLSVYGKK